MKNESQNYCKGQAVIIITIFFLFASLIIILGASSIALKESKIVNNLAFSQKSYFLAEGGVEDLTYRILNAKHYDPNENLILEGFSTNTIVSGEESDKEIISTANVLNLIRKVKTSLTNGSSVSFHYGVQAGDGGFVLENTSSISGNVYSNGPIQGAGSNLIRGDVVSAAASGSILGVHATSSAYSHTISNSLIDKDAYYQTISGTIVNGVLHPNSPDQPLRYMPISDDIIDNWEAVATSTIINSPCPYVIDDDITLGPVKIACDMEIKGKPTITLAGPVWVVGNITAKNSATIRLSSSLGKAGVAIIADNPSNRLTSSKIDFEESVQFQNSGTEGSYILAVSQNNSSENSGSERAIAVQNSVSGELLVYSGHGEILLQNSVDLREVTGYKIHLQNSAQVIYKTGLASLLFSSGPSGGYSIIDWEEVQ